MAMIVLSGALLVALFSAAVAQQGRVALAAASTVIALGLAGWVAVAIVPNLAQAHQSALGGFADRLQADARGHGVPRRGRDFDFGLGEYRK